MVKQTINSNAKRFMVLMAMIIFSFPLVFSQVLVKGTVRDNAREPLPGVSVKIVGSQKGAMTDADGKFSIVVPNKNASLSFSFVGFTTVKKKVDATHPMNITLQEDAKMLN